MDGEEKADSGCASYEQATSSSPLRSGSVTTSKPSATPMTPPGSPVKSDLGRGGSGVQPPTPDIPFPSYEWGHGSLISLSQQRRCVASTIAPSKSRSPIAVGKRHADRASSMPLLGQHALSRHVRRRSLSVSVRSAVMAELKVASGDGDGDVGSAAGPSSRAMWGAEQSWQVQPREQDPITERTLDASAPSTSSSHLQTLAPSAERMRSPGLAQRLLPPPTPPRRTLRDRKPAQLAPYTTEMQRYRRRLVRNDWEDAVVMEREYLRAQREKRREREEAGAGSAAEEQQARQRPKVAGRKSDNRFKRPSKDRPVPLRERRNAADILARFGKISSSSEDEAGLPDRAASPSNSRLDALNEDIDRGFASSSNSPGARGPSRKRSNNALQSDSEPSSVEVLEIPSDTTSDEDGGGGSNSATTVSDDDEGGASRRTGKEGYSAEESRYYKQQLRLLKRTMPKGAARRHIEDLIAMHREQEAAMQMPRDEQEWENGTSEQSTESLRPGQSRKRALMRRSRQDFYLIADADEESEHSSVPSPVSSDADTEGKSVDGKSDDDDFSEQWFYSVRHDTHDDIDRMLTSARVDPVAKKRSKGPRQRSRQARVSSRTAKDADQRPPKGPTKKRARKSGTTALRRGYEPPSRMPLRENPPVVQTRHRPRYSLLNDDSLFDSGLFDGHAEEARSTPARSTPGSTGHAQLPTLTSPLKVSPRHTPPQWQSLHGQKTTPIDVDKTSSLRRSVGKAGGGPALQKRLELPLIAHSTPKQLSKQCAEMDIWQDVADLRLDFGLRPPTCGMSFRPSTYVGKGRLFELVQLVKEGGLQSAPVAIHAFGLDLDPGTFQCNELQNIFEAAKDQLRALHTPDGPAEGDPRFAHALSELLRFVTVWVSTATGEGAQILRVRKNALEHVEALIVLVKGRKDSQHALGSAALLRSLRWFKVELAWRTSVRLAMDGLILADKDAEGVDMQMDFLQACQELMLELLIHGLNQTMQSIRTASENRDGPTGSKGELEDQSAQHWIGLLHLLSQDESVELFGPYCSFWFLFEAAMKQYQAVLSRAKNPLVVAENGWYCLFAVCTLSYFSASTGTSTSRTCLRIGHWPLVLQALSHVRVRADEDVESSMPPSALIMRDRYVRLTLCRVLQLSTVWGWSYESSEATLSKLFGFFDSHKLEDLPTETAHDFPVFLRVYDESRLMDAVQDDDTAFHIFVKILARAACHLQEIQGGERNVARLFSRFSPVRTMAFSRETPPTTLERSALYNHYTIALVYLYLVPTTHHQRLLQIQQYLSFSKADEKSQLVCIRAMMYAITVLQHHRLAIHEAVGWFKSAFKMLVGRLEELHRIGAMTGRELQWERDIKGHRTLLVASLRSIEYVIKTDSLDKGRSRKEYPDLQLLDLNWTSSLLESQLAVQDTRLALEVCHLLHAFFLRRLSALPERKKPDRSLKSAYDKEGESQDSYADLFDDVDFDDVQLLGAAGYCETTGGKTDKQKEGAIREQDRHFAQFLHTAVSPAIFRLLSNLFHPERVPRYSLARGASAGNHRPGDGYFSLLQSMIEQTTKTTLAETIIDTWSWSAWIMVEDAEVRPWGYYFNYGAEDPKRLQAEVGKRDVTLRFLSIVSCKCLHPTVPPLQSVRMYVSNMGEFWNAFMASVAARRLTSQHLLCNNLRELEGRRLAGDGGGLLDRMDWKGRTRWSLDDFEQNRLALLGTVLENCSLSLQHPLGPPKALLFSSITALLVSMRAYASEDSKSRQDGQYASFCQAVVRACRDKLVETLQRGVLVEMQKTAAVVEAMVKSTDGCG